MMGNTVGFQTLVWREMVRTNKVINQVVWPPVITTALYIVVLGFGLGTKVVSLGGVPYAAFLVPGLVMLQVIGETYGESSSSLFQGRFLNSIQEVLIAPLSAIEIVGALLLAGVLRALLIAALIVAIAFALVRVLPLDWPLAITMIAVVAVLFGSLGIIFGLLAEKFEHIAALTTFVITPLVFIGGVFTSSSVLPPAIRAVSLANPMVYMIDGFRYAFTGRNSADIPIGISLGLTTLLAIVAAGVALRMTALGIKLRT